MPLSNKIHNKRLFLYGLTACLMFFIMAVFFFRQKIKPSKKTLKIERKPKEKIIEKKPMEMPFYVFSTSIFPYPKNFAPSGYMGDIIDIMMTGSYDVKLKELYPCIKITYISSSEKGWSGIMWQNPANNWGDFDGGYDLSQAGKMSFWARGDKGGEVVEFKIGGVASVYQDSLNLSSGAIVLEKNWNQYFFPLKDYSRNSISGGFSIIVTKEDNPQGCIFYLDEVKYEN